MRSHAAQRLQIPGGGITARTRSRAAAARAAAAISSAFVAKLLGISSILIVAGYCRFFSASAKKASFASLRVLRSQVRMLDPVRDRRAAARQRTRVRVLRVSRGALVVRAPRLKPPDWRVGIRGHGSKSSQPKSPLRKPAADSPSLQLMLSSRAERHRHSVLAVDHQRALPRYTTDLMQTRWSTRRN